MGTNEIRQNTNDILRRMRNQWVLTSCEKEKCARAESQDRETQGHGWEVLCLQQGEQ